MPNVFKALSDPIFRQDVKRGVMDALNRGMVAGGLGAPVDLATMALRPFGYNVEKPVGGSEWIGDKMRQAGMVSDQRNALAEAAAGMLAPTGYADPVATARAVAGIIGAAQVAGPAQKAMFIGAGAKTWDKAAAAKAQALEAKGVDPRVIWKETGTFRGADGALRQEIDDSAAQVPKFSRHWRRPLDESMVHDPLEASYPDIKNLIFEASPGGNLSGAQYTKNGLFHDYGPRETILVRNTEESAAQNKSLTLHELQHAIQQREGWAAGGSPESMPLVLEDLAGKNKREARRLFDLAQRNDPLNPGDIVKPGAREKAVKAENRARDYENLLERINSFGAGYADDAYRRLAGEAEARATQARMNLNAKQRRELFPYDSYDVKPENLIVRLAR